MGYYIDFVNMSTDHLKEKLKNADLLPSRRILKEDIDKKFDRIKNQKITNVSELQNALKNKNKIAEFSEKSGLPEDYLKILIREINSFRPKPNLIKNFPGISDETILKLKAKGINDTFQLFEKVKTRKSRNALSEKTGISIEEIIKLMKLTDLSRIRWVNHSFANILYMTGYDTSEKVVNTDYKTLHEKIKQLNEEKQLFKGHIGLHDIKLCVEAAYDIQPSIEYEE